MRALPSIRSFALALAALTVLPLTAAAQDRWNQPSRFDRPSRYDQPSRFGEDGGRQQGRNQAGQFDYYTLVLSWSPTYCASPDRPAEDPQCDRRDGRRYAFVLHGLWPQYDRGFPEYCPVRGRPFVPQPVIDGMLDVMPSPRLVIHEYKKHGTCSGLDPQGYYGLSRRLFQELKIPDRYINPLENQMVAPDEIAEEFIKLNPGLRPDMLAVSCGGAGNRLREVRICYSKTGEFQPCGRNENQRKLCSALKMFVPPVRSVSQGRGFDAGEARRDDGSPLPGPRGLPPGR